MNANELADDFDKNFVDWNDYYKMYLWMNQASKMLRQQQAEIEALKLGDIQWKHAFDLAKIEIADLKAEIETLKERKISLSYADLEARLDWSRHEGSGASYLEGFEDGALWAEQEMRKAQDK